MTTLTARPVLTDTFWAADGSQVWLKRLVLLVAGVAALWISAKVQLATLPVPITLQMLVIMVIGASYGPKLAAATVASYIALGLQGLPVFAGTPERALVWPMRLGRPAGISLGS